MCFEYHSPDICLSDSDSTRANLSAILEMVTKAVNQQLAEGARSVKIEFQFVDPVFKAPDVGFIKVTSHAK